MRRRTALLVALFLLVQAPTAPASGLAVACGEGFPGVDGNYVEGRSNGHPEDEPDELDGWGGLTAVRDLKIAIFALERSEEIIENVSNTLDKGFDNSITKAVQVITLTVRAILHVTIQSLESVVLAYEIQNEDVNECSGALTGDFVDVLFLTALEENLAYMDLDGVDGAGGAPPAPGSRTIGAAMFALPQDGWPAWHSDGGLYDAVDGHTNEDLYYVDGALNGDFVGVAITVRNQIAYLEASGIDTGATTTTTGPDGQQVTVYGAKDLWHQAVELMAAGSFVEAHTRFALAYQTAVGQGTPPGATYPPADQVPPPDPEPTATPTSVPPNPWG